MILPTKNEAWGFWGTWSSNHGNADTQRAWDAMSAALAIEFRLRDEEVRFVLDSKLGRHLADQCESPKSMYMRQLVRKLNRGWRNDILDVAQHANAR